MDRQRAWARVQGPGAPSRRRSPFCPRDVILSVMSAARRLVLVLVAALTLLGAAPALADPAAREGRTVVQHAVAGSEGEFVDAAPGDAPRAGVPLTIPAVPAGFNTFDDGWIRFAYPPEDLHRVERLISASAEVRAELQERLGAPVLARVVVYVARTPKEMATFAPAGAPFPSYAAGVAYSEIGYVLLSQAPVAPGAPHDVLEVFRHELAHVALHDAAGGRHVPRWFNEGFAVQASGESRLVRLQTLASSTVRGSLLGLADLDQTFPADADRASTAYAQAADVVRFLVRKEDSGRFVSLVHRVKRGDAFDSALSDAYGVSTYQLEQEWRRDVARRYSFWPVLFGGSFFWVGAIGLMVWGYGKRRARATATLARWEREEAADDARRRLLASAAAAPRVHIVLAREPVAAAAPTIDPVLIEPEVPRVEHDGTWHTLH